MDVPFPLCLPVYETAEACWVSARVFELGIERSEEAGEEEEEEEQQQQRTPLTLHPVTNVWNMYKLRHFLEFLETTRTSFHCGTLNMRLAAPFALYAYRQLILTRSDWAYRPAATAEVLPTWQRWQQPKGVLAAMTRPVPHFAKRFVRKVR